MRWSAAATLEDEDMAEHRIVFQRRLYLCGKAVEAVAHISGKRLF